MKTSIKHLLRTPIKLCTLILSIIAISCLLVLGLSMFYNSSTQLQTLEDSYTTIGMIEQKPNAFLNKVLWDNESNSYINSQEPVYDSISLDSLNFETIQYLQKPKRNHYYGAYLPTYKNELYDIEDSLGNEFHITDFSHNLHVIEFHVDTNAYANDKILIQIDRMLAGVDFSEENSQFYLDCSNLDDNLLLEAHKTYIMVVYSNQNLTNDLNFSIEFIPTTKSELSINTNEWEEVTENFYETPRGKYWLNYIRSKEMLSHITSVLSTNSFHILPSFHNNNAYLIDGRKITEEEFKQGKKVCILPKQFALRNNLTIKDKISLPLYYSVYDLYGTSSVTRVSMLDESGKLYEPFSTEEYEVVGIYDYQGVDENNYFLDVDNQTIIIPEKAVVSDKDHIASFGPFGKDTTTFQIANGSIDEYEQVFMNSKASSLFDITFDDGGYSLMKNELEKTLASAYMLCIIGILSSTIVLVFLIYIFIIKERGRIFLERSLGMQKKQCIQSLLSGFLFIVLIASFIGSFLGLWLMKINPALPQTSNYFSLAYSVNKIASIPLNDINVEMNYFHLSIGILIPITIAFIITILAILFINKEFKKDIMHTQSSIFNE